MAKKKTGRDTDADYETDAEVDAAEDAERDEGWAEAPKDEVAKVDVVDKGAVVSDRLRSPEGAERAAVKEQVLGQPYEGRATLELLETTDVEDIQALSNAIVEVIQGAAYDDMTWPEVDMALRRTSHAIRQNWAATGTVKTAPVEPVADGLRSSEDAAARDVKSAEEKPTYAG